MSIKLLTEHHFEFLSLKGDCTGLSESTLVKMPHCWKSHVTALLFTLVFNFYSAPVVTATVINLQAQFELFGHTCFFLSQICFLFWLLSFFSKDAAEKRYFEGSV